MTAIDQEARDLARDAQAEISKHAAVCIEARRADEKFQQDVRDWLRRIEETYATAARDIKRQVEEALRSQKSEVTKLGNELREETRNDLNIQRDINKDLYNRYWALLIAYASAITGACVFFLGKFEHWF